MLCLVNFRAVNREILIKNTNEDVYLTVISCGNVFIWKFCRVSCY